MLRGSEKGERLLCAALIYSIISIIEDNKVAAEGSLKKVMRNTFRTVVTKKLDHQPQIIINDF